MAQSLIAAIEGGFTLARTHHSADPLRQAGGTFARALANTTART